MTERQALSSTIFSLLPIKSSMSSLLCSSCSHWAVSWQSCWMCFFFCFCPASAGSSGGALSAIGRHNRRCPTCTVCRQCTTNVRGGRCLSQFQICVCVSGLVLSVSKFSLCQSASAVTKSLRSPVDASCQSVKKTRKAVCWYIEQPRDSCSAPALRHNRDFNIATAQRQH